MFEDQDRYNINVNFYVLLEKEEAKEYLDWIVKNRNSRYKLSL